MSATCMFLIKTIPSHINLGHSYFDNINIFLRLSNNVLKRYKINIGKYLMTTLSVYTNEVGHSELLWTNRIFSSFPLLFFFTNKLDPPFYLFWLVGINNSLMQRCCFATSMDEVIMVFRKMLLYCSCFSCY